MTGGQLTALEIELASIMNALDAANEIARIQGILADVAIEPERFGLAPVATAIDLLEVLHQDLIEQATADLIDEGGTGLIDEATAVCRPPLRVVKAVNHPPQEGPGNHDVHPKAG